MPAAHEKKLHPNFSEPCKWPLRCISTCLHEASYPHVTHKKFLCYTIRTRPRPSPKSGACRATHIQPATVRRTAMDCTWTSRSDGLGLTRYAYCRVSVWHMQFLNTGIPVTTTYCNLSASCNTCTPPSMLTCDPTDSWHCQVENPASKLRVAAGSMEEAGTFVLLAYIYISLASKL